MKFMPIERRVGLIILSTDPTPERDLVPALNRAGIFAAVSKIFYRNPISAQSLRDIGSRLTASADLLPAESALAAIAFCCTSAAIEIGEEGVTAAIQAAKPSAGVTSAAGAVHEEMQRYSAKRIALFAPYEPPITARIARHLERLGFTVVTTFNLGLDDDRTIAAIDPTFIVEWVAGADLGAVDAVLISCTALRSMEIETAIAQAIARPVVTSNGALLAVLKRRIAAAT